MISRRRHLSATCLAAIVAASLAAPSLLAQVRLSDESDRAAFRAWFVLLADAAYYEPVAEVTDCAGLVRYAMREALRPLVPEAVLTRSKMGFPVPFGSWMRGAHRSTLDEYVLSSRALDRKLFRTETVRRIVNEHLTGTRSHGDRLWLLVNLELWLRMAIDGEEPQPLERRMERVAVSV